jgi:DNA-binding CsgD family transcriptional regulator
MEYRPRHPHCLHLVAAGHRPDDTCTVKHCRSLHSGTSQGAVVLQLIAEGCGTADIAGKLHLSENTVKTHVRRLCQLLGARNRAHAVAEAFRSGALR